MEMTLVKSLYSGDPEVICPVDSEYMDLQVLMSWPLADALLMPCKCFSVYILVQFMFFHVCSGDDVTHALGGAMCRCSE